MKDIFKTLISDFLEKEMPEIIEREIDIPLNSKKIISLIGARRTGKTYLFFSLIKKLRRSHHRNRIIYINFEDDRLFPLFLKDLNLFVEAYYELYPDNRTSTVYLFFDEIQNIENWEKFIRRIYDSLNCKIFITGSSSKYLSREIATSLRGRTISFEVFPFSFREYLKYKGIETSYVSSANRSRLVNAFEMYLNNSSLPELLEAPSLEKSKILKEYLDLVIYKDLIERYKITNIYLIRYLIKFLLTNSGNPVSITKIYHDLKSQSVKVSKNSLYQYLEYLTDAYILFPVKIFSNNIRAVQRNPQKMYSLDSGLVDTVSITKDMGRRFENVVFLELRRHYQEISYYKRKQEIDFCFQNEGELHLINASLSLNNTSTKTREIKGLMEGMEYLNINESRLITKDHNEMLKIDDKTISIIPIWQWLLQEKPV